MGESGLLGPVLGGVPQLASFANMVKVEATTGLGVDAARRLGALGVLVVEDAERLWQRLRLTNVEHERLQAMGERWRQVSPAIGEHAARALLYRLGPQRFVDRVLLAWTHCWSADAADADWRALATLPQRFVAPAFPLRAAHFLTRGVPKGPQLGAALRAAEEAWVAQDFPADRGALAAIVDAGIAASRGPA